MFIKKYNLEGISYPPKQMIGKRLRKIIQQLPITFCVLKKTRYVELIIQKLIRTVKNK